MEDVSETLVAARIPIGVVGLVLLVAGARLYRVAIVGPGFAAGVFAGLQLTLGAAADTRAVAALALGLIGGVAMHFLERVAVSVAGAVLAGGLANAAAPRLLPDPVPWYVPAAASLVGLLLFPRLFLALLPLITAVLGALCLGWAAARPHDLWLLGGLATGGLLVQIATRPKERRD